MSEEEELRRVEYQHLKDKLINAKNKIDYSLKNYNAIINQIKQDLVTLKKIKDLDFETFNKEFDAWFNNLLGMRNAINDKLVSISVGIEAYDLPFLLPFFVTRADRHTAEMVEELRAKYFTLRKVVLSIDNITRISDVKAKFRIILSQIDVDDKLIKFLTKD